MTTLIKIFITLFLVSCNLVPEMRSVFNTSFSSLETVIKESDDNVDKRVVLKYGRFNYSAFSKKFKDNELWSNDSSISFKICNFKICFYKQDSNELIFETSISINEIILNKKDFYKTYIRFNNPESGMLTYISEFKIIGEGQMKGLFDNKDYSYILLEENFSVPKIRWKGVNYFYVDKDDFELIRLSQSISPFQKNVSLFYK